MSEPGLTPAAPGEPIAAVSAPRPRVAGGVPGGSTLEDPAPRPVGHEFWGGDDEPDEGGKNLHRSLRTVIEWVAVAIGALAVALLIKAFLLQAFWIPSSSMEPTLEVDDRVLVNKLSYRFGDVQRGDVIVFDRPERAPGDIEDFIKRVIALPGETISFSEGDVFIGGDLLIEDYLAGAPTRSDSVIPGCSNEPAVADFCVVPDGHVFVLGDNRSSSFDSRRFGPIPEDSIVGRAFVRVWPLGDLGFL